MMDKYANFYKTILFPASKGKDLTQVKYVFPGGLHGKINIVVLAFTRKQQKSLKGWITHFKKLRKTYKGLDYGLLPMMASVPGFVMYFIVRGMRKMYKNLNDRQRMILVYTKKTVFIKSLNIFDTNRINVFLIDKKGRIFWRTRGKISPSSKKSLQLVLDKIYHKP